MLIQNYIVDELLSIKKNFYDHDYDSNNDFNDLIQLTTICSIKFRVIIDEKFLTLKKILIDFYSKQFNNVFLKKMNEYKRINIYKRMKQFNFFNNVKILSSRLIFKMKKKIHDEIKKFKIR